jgi:hypothetical protein
MRKVAVKGQARIMEAIAATIIILILAVLMPILFKAPATTLRSEIQVGEEQYAYNVLYDVYANPQFLNYIQQGNWSALKQLMDTTIGPQFNWFLCVEPLTKALNITGTETPYYVGIPIQIIPTGAGGYAELTLNLKVMNWLLPLGYSINTSLPLSNVFFATSNGKPVYWWVQSYDPNTGNAVIWFMTTSTRLMMYVSRNGTYPYNPLTNQYCTTPYCPPYGGLSTFEIRSLGASQSLNNGGSVFSGSSATYYGFTSQNTECSGASPSTPLILATPEGSSASCQLDTELTITSPLVLGFLTKFVSAIPGSTLTLSMNIIVNVVSGGSTLLSQTIPIQVTYMYNQNNENILLTVNGNQASLLGNYTYLSGSLLTIMPSLQACPGGFAINITTSLLTYDYLSGSNLPTLNSSYATPCITGVQLSQVSITTQLNGISIQQTSPYNPYYLYSTTNVIYDLWIAPLPSTTYVNPVFINYGCLSNTVPPNYAYRFAELPFTPTAEAYTIVQLQNGSYYLALIALQSLSRG